MNLNSILIGTEDAPRLTAYYTKLLGAQAWDNDGIAGWLIGSGAVTVLPHSEVHGQSTQPGRIIWNIESPDVAADFARFKAAGAIVVREPYGFEGAPDTLIATFADPDGNYFQLVSPFDPRAMG